jgi:DNA replication and repair protein RecF
MSYIESVQLQHVRSHADYTLSLSPDVTLITGSNGSGKTTIIEAIHIALQGTSFKGGDNDILEFASPWYRIDLTFNDKSKRTVKFDPSRVNGKKQFELNERTHYRLSYQHKYPIVLFEPEDLRLLNGSPTRRRDFIDTFISQLDAEYGVSLRRYERALKQRNNLLKRVDVRDDELFPWNVSLSQYGAYIINRRLHFIDKLNNDLSIVYKDISHSEDIIQITYSYHPHSNLQQKLLSELHAQTPKDKIVGFTSVGPHRHDVLFYFNNSPALSVASRGEVRTVVLALKFLEVRFIESLTGLKPVILLDDVFSELDKTRQQKLIKQFSGYQTIIASVESINVPGNIIDLSY